MTPITPERCMELARRHSAYEPESKTVTLRGDESIQAFARDLLALHEGQRIAELVSVRAALEGQAPRLTVAGFIDDGAA